MAEPRQVPSQSVKHSAHSCAFVRRRLPRLALFLSDQRSQGPLDRGCERFEEWVSLLEPITPSCDNRYWVPFILGQAIVQALLKISFLNSFFKKIHTKRRSYHTHATY